MKKPSGLKVLFFIIIVGIVSLVALALLFQFYYEPLKAEKESALQNSGTVAQGIPRLKAGDSAKVLVTSDPGWVLRAEVSELNVISVARLEADFEPKGDLPARAMVTVNDVPGFFISVCRAHHEAVICCLLDGNREDDVDEIVCAIYNDRQLGKRMETAGVKDGAKATVKIVKVLAEKSKCELRLEQEQKNQGLASQNR